MAGHNARVDADPGARPPLVARIAVVIAGTVVIWGTIFVIASSLAEQALAARALYAVIACGGAVLLIVWARRRLDRRPWEGVAFPVRPPSGRALVAGLVAFVAPAAVGCSVGLATGAVSLTIEAATGEVLAVLATVIVSVLVYEAVPEELIFRGYIFRNLTTAMAPVAAVAVQAALFTVCGTALWVAGEGWQVFGERVGLFFGMGVVLGMIRIVSRDVWSCIGFHWAFQVIAQLPATGAVTIDGAWVAFVMVPPFVAGTAIVSLAVRARPNWTAREPDRADVEPPPRLDPDATS